MRQILVFLLKLLGYEPAPLDEPDVDDGVELSPWPSRFVPYDELGLDD